MPRVVIGTVSNPALGRMYEQLFQQAGIPVTSMRAMGSLDFYSTGPTELWLEDEDLLQDPDVASFIDDVLKADHSRDAESGQTQMPTVEPETPPTAAWPAFWFGASLLWTWVVSVLLIVLFIFVFSLLYNTFF
ncbi:MAG: hypothetical protein WAO58_02900 [Fimbriimonadaceae bacterium]